MSVQAWSCEENKPTWSVGVWNWTNTFGSVGIVVSHDEVEPVGKMTQNIGNKR
jgi:hypothetical protein